MKFGFRMYGLSARLWPGRLETTAICMKRSGYGITPENPPQPCALKLLWWFILTFVSTALVFLADMSVLRFSNVVSLKVSTTPARKGGSSHEGVPIPTLASLTETRKKTQTHGALKKHTRAHTHTHITHTSHTNTGKKKLTHTHTFPRMGRLQPHEAAATAQ